MQQQQQQLWASESPSMPAVYKLSHYLRRVSENRDGTLTVRLIRPL